jgi:alkylation response protein AidB-like acyl-CoA dehydrogenase
VDFELTSDQVALQEGMRGFCQGRFGIDVVRGLESHGGVERGAWRELADMGVFSLRLPESEGGVELGWADAALVFEELGRALVPGPLVWTHLSATYLPGAADGTVVVGGVDRHEPTRLIEYAGVLDRLFVIDENGVSVVEMADVDVEPIANPLDPLVPLGRYTGKLPKGQRIAGPEETGALRQQGTALVAAILLGVAEAATDLAVAYAKERFQFDKPIGAFQAVKHLLADMFTATELARAAVYAAAVTIDDPAVGSVERAVLAAKLVAAEAALTAGKSCVQVHGGMGYTWEVDAHLLLKRAYALEPLFGSRDACADQMADFVSPSL